MIDRIQVGGRGFADVGGVHRLDQVGAAEFDQAGAMGLDEADLEGIGVSPPEGGVVAEGTPDVGDEDLGIAEPALCRWLNLLISCHLAWS